MKFWNDNFKFAVMVVLVDDCERYMYFQMVETQCEFFTYSYTNYDSLVMIPDPVLMHELSKTIKY